MSNHSERNAMHEAMVFYWGGRCPEHDAECPACQAWGQYDAVVATAPEGVLRMVETWKVVNEEQTNMVLECSPTTGEKS